MPLLLNIRKLKAKGEVDALAKALGHGNPRIRREAADALTELGGDRTVAAIVKVLEETMELPPPAALEAAADVLQQVVAAQNVGVLTNALLADRSLAERLLRNESGYNILRVALGASDTGTQSKIGVLVKEAADRGAADRGAVDLPSMLGHEFKEVGAVLWPPETDEQQAAREDTERRWEAERLDAERLEHLRGMASLDPMRETAEASDLFSSAVRAACRMAAAAQREVDRMEEAWAKERFPTEDEAVFHRRQTADVHRTLTEARGAAERYASELAAISPRRATETLTELLQDEDELVRRCARLAFGPVSS